MKPTKPGIYEWFDQNNVKKLVEVCDVGIETPYLRVCWWGGYYNVNDEHDPEEPEYDHLAKTEWPDRWGSFVGTQGSIPEDQIYSMPTPEERTTIYRDCDLTS